MSDNGKRPPPQALAGGLEFAKWVALLTMTVDHFGKIVMPEWIGPTHALGRLSYPLFAGIVGLRLAERPALGERYLRRLLPWAVVSQPAFVLAGREWSDLNIMATLASGVLLAAGLERVGRGVRPLGVLLVAAGLGLAPFVEFGPIGPLVIPLLALGARRAPLDRFWLVGLLGVVANIVVAAPPLEPVDLCALGAAPVLWLSLRWSAALPRLPTAAFYAYYPLHLLFLDRLDRFLG